MEHRKFGYICVSSKDQNEGRQLEARQEAGVKKTSFYKLVKALEEETANTLTLYNRRNFSKHILCSFDAKAFLFYNE